jgi:hypothetical protein
VRRALLLCLLAALCGAPGARTDNTDLLQAYSPVLYFHASEQWAPEPVETFLADARLERQVAKGSWKSTAQPLPTSNAGCTLTPCYRLNLPCPLHGGAACYSRMPVRANQWQKPVIYGRVVSAPPNVLVRYWLFFEFDDYHTLHKRMWQAHEGDWESITISIDANGQPQFAAYSQHCSGSVRNWSAVEKRGTHPVAYVALGSHANYFTNRPVSTRFTECLKSGIGGATVTRLAKLAQERVVDRTGTAHQLGPSTLTVIPLDPATVSWARFPGRWSEGQLLWLGTTPRRFTSVSQGDGPATPHWSSTSIPSLWHVESS